ncbi:hypothetical protein OAJ95_03830 [Pelagibacteraceae bacterium]|nr:hypothetical protein [Pelagibacteraceae bacterium]
MISKNNFKNLIHKFSLKKLNEIKLYKNLHLNDECYLFGDGPSIKWFDLNNFNNKVGFTCGKIFYHKDYKKLNLKYLSIAEPFYFSPIFLMTHKRSGGNYEDTKGKLILKKDPLICNIKKKILNLNQISIFLNLSNFPFFLNKKNIIYLFKDIPNFQLIENIYKNNLHPFQGSMSFAIMILIYMGFKKIHLVGFDYYFDQPISGHWFEKGTGIKIELNDKKNELFFKLISDTVEIISITKDCKSRYTNSIEYSELCDNELKYRENSELCSEEDLNTFNQSAWHSYRIY